MGIIRHDELLKLLSNIQIPQSEDFNKLFLLTKKEGLIRDLLLVQIEKAIREKKKELEYIAYPEWNYHDCVVLKKVDENTYVPITLIEYKYATSPFILGRKNVNLLETFKSHDSIWLENYSLKKEEQGKVSGVRTDIYKMLKTSNFIQEQGYSKPNLHQVITVLLANPTIHKELYLNVQPKFRKNAETYVIQNDFVNFKEVFQRYQNNSEQQKSDIRQIITEQYEIIRELYFPKQQMNVGFSSLPIGKAYGTEMELLFFVISLD